MIVPVRCPSCGMPIGQVEPVFIELQKEKMKKTLEEYDTLPSKASANLNIEADCEDIFNLLIINNLCCRMHIMSTFYFHDKLN